MDVLAFGSRDSVPVGWAFMHSTSHMSQSTVLNGVLKGRDSTGLGGFEEGLEFYAILVEFVLTRWMMVFC